MWSIADGGHPGRPVASLLLPAVHPLVQQSAARAQLDHPRHLVGFACVGQRPGSAVQFEDVALSAKALADVDADVEVEAHLDVSAAVDLAHLANTRLSLSARGNGVHATNPRTEAGTWPGDDLVRAHLQASPPAGP